MNNKDLEYHNKLMSTYLFHKSLYSFSFKERTSIDLGMITFTHSHYSKELDKLSNKELEDKFEVLKKPWWNNIYEKSYIRIRSYYPLSFCYS